MQRAWYGVVPTGNQAGYALELLVNTFKDDYPAAVEPLTSHRYVDDVISGAATPEDRDLQVDQSIQVLAQGGFKYKHVIKSREDPPDFAQIGSPLHKLTSKETHWKGGQLPPDCLAAYSSLKQALCSEPVVDFRSCNIL